MDLIDITSVARSWKPNASKIQLKRQFVVFLKKLFYIFYI